MTNEKETVNKVDMPQSGKNGEADQLTVEQWLAIRKEAALRIDPDTADPMDSTPSFQRNFTKSGENTSPVLPEATYGCGLAISPKRPKMLCGKSTSADWRFRRDFRELKTCMSEEKWA